MSNVYTGTVEAGNSIVSYHSGREYRPGISYVNPTPSPRVHYKRARRKLGNLCLAYVFEC